MMKRVTAYVKPMAVDTLGDYFDKIGYPVLKMCIKDRNQVAARSIFWRNYEYEYVFRLKSSMVKKNIMTEDGRWTSLAPRQEQVITEEESVAKHLEVLEIV